MASARENEQAELERKYDELYAAYGKPLEPEHRGEFLAISLQGDFVLGGSFNEVADEGVNRFGRGIFVYKVGERAALKWVTPFLSGAETFPSGRPL